MKSGFGIRRKKVTNASSPKLSNGPVSWHTATRARKRRAKFSSLWKARSKSPSKRVSNRQRPPWRMPPDSDASSTLNSQLSTALMSSVVKIDPEIMSGAPCFSGTRVAIQTLIDHLEAGDSIEDFLDGFPSVSREQVVAFLEANLLRPRKHSGSKFLSPR